VNSYPGFTIRPHIIKMPPYEPILPLDVLSKELGIDEAQIIKLDANENPYGSLPEVADALADMINFAVYPDPEARRLRALLSEYHGVAEKSIVLGAGVDELIDLIMRLTLDPDDILVNCPPTFGMYAFGGALNQAAIINIYRKSDFSLDIETLRGSIRRHRPKLIFLANPNNPDGGMVAPEIIHALLKMPLLVVLDEAYANFSPEPQGWIDQVSSSNNLIVLRSFSKWAGLAGLRIGYGIFPESLVPIFQKAKQPYNVSVMAEQAACISLMNDHKLQANVDKIISERALLFRKLSSISWLRPYPSSANFILCRVLDKEAAAVKQGLMNQGILIRYFDKPGLRDHIRISVGRPDHTDRLIRALYNLE